MKIEHEDSIDGECELLVTLERLEAKIDAIAARLDAGVAAPGTRTLTELGTRIRREIDRHGVEDPDRCVSAKWLNRLLGAGVDLIATELEAMVTDGLLYSRPFYRGKLYYRCGHGPAVKARTGKPSHGVVVGEITEEICRIVKQARVTSQTAAEAHLRRSAIQFRRQDFWSSWSDLVRSGHLVKKDDGVYVISR